MALAGTGDDDGIETVTAADPPTATAASAVPTTTTTVVRMTTTTSVATITTTTTSTTATSTTTALLRVVDVIDGDTVDLSDGSRVRLIGIDTPERGECGYQEATGVLQGFLGDGYVALVTGARDDRDRYGRLLRYIEVGSVDVNLEMIRSGRATARYDSRDGYGRHAREDAYVAADANTPSVNTCTPPATSPAAAPPAPAAATPPAAPGPAASSGCDPNYDPCVPIDTDVSAQSAEA